MWHQAYTGSQNDHILRLMTERAKLRNHKQSPPHIHQPVEKLQTLRSEAVIFSFFTKFWNPHTPSPQIHQWGERRLSHSEE